MIQMRHIDHQRKYLKMDIDEVVFPKGYLSVVLGPNGQGKSTLLKLLVGAIEDAGMQVDGVLATDIAWMSDTYPFFGGMFTELVDMVTLMHPDFNAARFDELVRLFHIRKNSENRSLGEQCILGFCIALTLNRKVLVMDEPTLNLDETHKAIMLHLIQEFLEEEDKTVILATNSVETFVDIADAFVYVDKGKVLYNNYLKDALENNVLWEGETRDLPQQGVLVTRRHETYMQALVDIKDIGEQPYRVLGLIDWLHFIEGGEHHE